MASGPESDDPDDIFAGFVRKANAEWVASVEAVLSELEADLGASGAGPEERDREGTDRVVLLTTRKSHPPAAEAATAVRREDGVRGDDAVRRDDVTVRERVTDVQVRAVRKRRSLARSTEDWSSVVPERSTKAQRREAAALVPDVASVPPPATHAAEGSENGQIPSGELDRKLSDMDVLVRYGHVSQVEAELEALRLRYPDDLLLLRGIAELYVRHALRGPALEALFTLATGLFERRNVEGMRQALEQALVLDPENGRAQRLLSLLDQRPSAMPGRRR